MTIHRSAFTVRSVLSLSMPRSGIGPRGDKWSNAIYLGRERQHGQHVLYDDQIGKATFARTVIRVPNAEKWKPDSIAAVSALPWSLHEPRKPEVTFKD